MRVLWCLMLSLVVIETLTAEGTKSAPRQTPDTSDNSRKIGLPGVQQSSELDFDRLKAKADDAKKSNQVPEAIDLFNQLLRIKPRWAEGWWYLGTLYYESDQYASGVSAFERLVALEPKNSWGWAMLGLCEYQTKEYVASLEHLAKGRSLGLGDNQELARVVRYHQAILLTRVKRFEAAQTLLNGFAVEHRESDSILDGLGMASLTYRWPDREFDLGRARDDSGNLVKLLSWRENVRCPNRANCTTNWKLDIRADRMSPMLMACYF